MKVARNITIDLEVDKYIEEKRGLASFSAFANHMLKECILLEKMRENAQ